MALEFTDSPSELPDSDGVPMETDTHRDQMLILVNSLRDYFQARGLRHYVSGNSFVYYKRPDKNVGPDVYVVLDASPDRRRYWCAWEESNKLPSIVVELISKTTEAEDRGRKFILYRDVFKTKDYLIYDPLKQRLDVFRRSRKGYLANLPAPDGRIHLSALKLSVGVVDGFLRWFSSEGDLLLTGEERAEAEHRRAEAERLRAEAEHRRAEEEHRRAEEERHRADRAEAEARRLAEEVDRLRRRL